MMKALRIWFSDLVFKYKCKAGFVRLGPVEVIGTVEWFEHSSDGDVCFNLLPDEANHPVLEYSGQSFKTVHCEIVPRDEDRFAEIIAQLRVGMRLKVSGTKAWDGCHYGNDFLNVICVLFRAAPVLNGWVEIHPVDGLVIL